MFDLFKKTEQGVKKSKESWFGKIASIFSRSSLGEEVWQELEELLVSADVGVETTNKLLSKVRQRVKTDSLSETSQIREALKEEMVGLLNVRPSSLLAQVKATREQPVILSSDLSGRRISRQTGQNAETLHFAQGDEKRACHCDADAFASYRSERSEESPGAQDRLREGEESPLVILVVGVNGSGKTTSIAKLAYSFTSQGKPVILAAADTFRAAAIEQLKHWGQRAGAEVIAHKPGGDPGAVAYDAVQAGYSRHAYAVIIDTAGRLHTKFNLMEELKKVKRVVAKHDPSAPHQVLLVMDATTGQNGLLQAKYFTEAVGVTDIFLAKLDGTAKGGIAFAICDQLHIPISYIGTGERLEDMAPFDARTFVDAIFS